jgi:hypothetical protein
MADWKERLEQKIAVATLCQETIGLSDQRRGAAGAPCRMRRASSIVSTFAVSAWAFVSRA